MPIYHEGPPCPGPTKAIRLSPWTSLDGYSAMRFVEETDPEYVANRVAFIEKTARIRIAPFTTIPHDSRNWKEGHRGSSCSGDRDASVVMAYGFDPESRAWCDRELVALGYVLT